MRRKGMSKNRVNRRESGSGATGKFSREARERRVRVSPREPETGGKIGAGAVQASIGRAAREWFWGAVLLWVGVLAVAEPTARVVLQERACVVGPSIRLGDVAEVEAPTEATEELRAVELGPAPLPGRTRTVSLGVVKLRLRRYGFRPEEMVFGERDEVRVVRSRVVRSAARAGSLEAAAVAQGRPAVKRRERVRVVIQQGSVRITAPAEALADAATGEDVKVRLLLNNHILRGRVQGAGVVVLSL